MPPCFWAALEFSDSRRCTDDRALVESKAYAPRVDSQERRSPDRMRAADHNGAKYPIYSLTHQMGLFVCSLN